MSGHGTAREPHFLTRQDSASQGKWSNDVILVVETGTIDEIRKKMTEGLMNCPDSLLAQSMRNEHALRTPLMAAAASGDFALFTAVMHGVDRAIDQTAGRKHSAEELETKQLTIKDNWGMTLAMIAAESGMVPMIRAVLRRIESIRDYDRLIDIDYRGNTVLMHAAGAGRSATFDAFLLAIEVAFSEAEVEEQLRARSGNGWNILMHAARCGDQLGVTAVINACKINLSPAKVRQIVEEVDGDGMSFLMHAASGSPRKPDATPRRREVPSPQTPRPGTGAPSAPGSTRSRGGGQAGRFSGITEEDDDDMESGGAGSPATRSHAHTAVLSPAASDDARGWRFDSGAAPQIHPSSYAPLVAPPPGSAAMAGQAQVHGQGQGHEGVDDQPVQARRRSKAETDPSLVVFKTAWSMVENVLWKDQLREQLKLTDTWGRNILIHAVRSGRVHIFESAFNAMREHILDPETNELMDVDQEDNNISIMEAALEVAPREMVALVARRDQELKKAIAQAERESTIEAKMQSFIPGKLIVIFQLLLPETGPGHHGPVILLLLLTVMAPLLTWATELVARDKPVLVKDARRSRMTNLLSAPAIFFWGIGTSDIGSDSLGWSKTSSAAALAVATIIIPGLDAFFANQRVEQWLDKFACQSMRHSRKADFAWHKMTKKLKEQKDNKERRKFAPGASIHIPNKWAACGRLCQSQDAIAEAATTPAHPPVPQPQQLLRRLVDPSSGFMEEKEMLFVTAAVAETKQTEL